VRACGERQRPIGASSMTEKSRPSFCPRQTRDRCRESFYCQARSHRDYPEDSAALVRITTSPRDVPFPRPVETGTLKTVTSAAERASPLLPSKAELVSLRLKNLDNAAVGRTVLSLSHQDSRTLRARGKAASVEKEREERAAELRLPIEKHEFH
jgi:hypothetical protein